MIKLRLASDLHLEFLGDYHSHPANNGRDWNSTTILPIMENEKEQTLVLAGDIIMIKYRERFKPFFRDISERFQQVIVICGNHEFYKYNFLTGYEDYREFLFEFKNIILLQDQHICLGDYAIFGATLWTNMDKRNPYAMGYASSAMSDFRVIEYSAHDGSNHMRWTPELSVLEHEKTIEAINAFCVKYKDHKKIIVSHHLPSEQCGDIKFLGSPLNPAFSSDLDDIIYEQTPVLWISGHTHASYNFLIYHTQMLCNPRGYNDGLENPDFDPNLLITLS